MYVWDPQKNAIEMISSEGDGTLTDGTVHAKDATLVHAFRQMHPDGKVVDECNLRPETQRPNEAGRGRLPSLELTESRYSTAGRAPPACVIAYFPRQTDKLHVARKAVDPLLINYF
jgi:hypothetical protein